MTWQSIPGGYDAPPGEKIRIIYEVDVPPWLEWTPDEVMDFIVYGVGTIWAEIQRAVADFDVEKYEIKTIKPGDIYHIIIYGTSRGLAVWAAAAIILGLILAILIGLDIFVKDIQKWIPPEVIEKAVPLGALALFIIALASLVRRRE